MDKIRLMGLFCLLFWGCTEIVWATSGWENVRRNVGDGCSVSIIHQECRVSTDRDGDQIRIRVHADLSRPEYDFNSNTLFFRFDPIEIKPGTKPEHYSDNDTRRIDFDYLVTFSEQATVSTDWTYFIIDKKSSTVFGPFTETEFLERPETIVVSEWNWRSPRLTRTEIKWKERAFAVMFLFIFFCVNLYWIGPLLLLILIVVIVRRRTKRRQKIQQTQ